MVNFSDKEVWGKTATGGWETAFAKDVKGGTATGGWETAHPGAGRIQKKAESCRIRLSKAAITYSPAFAVPSALQGLTSLFG
ncbi:MAG: hypothetical protein K2K98_02815, partial [Muribaculaceae bacterium]|nr:hypothetical protein [Muribaculaceae bacterium]